jgi:diguanylate cyclase (GGDEF)-like protein/PAS domain S-box-containing protein
MRRLAVEHAVMVALSRAEGPADAARQFVEIVCRELGWPCGACWLKRPSDGALECVATWGDRSTGVDAFVEATRTPGPAAPPCGAPPGCGSAYGPAWVGEPGAFADSRAHLAVAAGLRSTLRVPVAADGGTLGFAEFFSRGADPADAELLDCARMLGDALGRSCLRARGEQQLREDTKRFSDTVELAAIGIAHVDAGGRFVHVNRWLCALLGYTREELLGLTVKQLSHPEDKNVTDDVRMRMRSGEIPFFQIEKRYLRKDGTPVWVSLTISVQRDTAGLPLHDIATFQDISARRQAEQALRRSEQRFRCMVELSSDWYWELDADLRFTTFEGHGSDSRYLPARVLLGCRAWEIPGADQQTDWVDLRTRLERREPLRDFEYSYTDRHEQRFYISVSGEALFDEDGRFVGYRGTSRDISLRKQAEARIRYLATHDELTGLPNRTMFSELLSHVLHGARRTGGRLAVLFVDLDRFKFINDNLGHDAGDTLLREVASRLKSCLRSSDVVARLGGDEFVVLLPDLYEAEPASTVARKVLSAVIRPVVLHGQEWRVTASVGISIFPDDAHDEPSLMKHADIAMYHAKEEGKNTFQFYDGRLKALSLERLTIEAHLRRAIERDELTLHYQAKVDLATNRIAGVEALLRWHGAELGTVTPAKFIPLAEETGLILPIGRWVLQTACAQSVAWQRAGLPPLPIAVNLSPRQLADPGLVADVRAVLDGTGLQPGLLELEVTESSVMHNVDRAVDVMTALKSMGVRLAIDDFGTGYSSLAQLKRFPIDTLKVDRSFIREIPDDPEDRAIAEAIIAMGKTLSLTVVAEGVETAAQKEFLRARACHQMQGFHFSKPLPAGEFAELLLRQRESGPAGGDA